jgi:hypothetical protein
MSLPIAANQSFTIWTFSSMLIESSPIPYTSSRGVGDSADIDVNGNVRAAGLDDADSAHV